MIDQSLVYPFYQQSLLKFNLHPYKNKLNDSFVFYRIFSGWRYLLQLLSQLVHCSGLPLLLLASLALPESAKKTLSKYFNIQ